MASSVVTQQLGNSISGSRDLKRASTTSFRMGERMPMIPAEGRVYVRIGFREGIASMIPLIVVNSG